MTRNIPLRLVLVVLIVLAGGVGSARQPDSRPGDMELFVQWLGDGLPAQPGSVLDGLDRANLLLRFAAGIGQEYAPLHAYSPKVACDEKYRSALVAHPGTAAILVTSIRTIDGEPDGALAIYRPTAADAMTDARLLWCGYEGWMFATTLPLPGPVAVSDRGYLVPDVAAVHKRLDEFVPTDWQRMASVYVSLGVPVRQNDNDADVPHIPLEAMAAGLSGSPGSP